MSVKIWFAKSKGFIPAIVRIALLSPWDRVAIDFSDGYVFESCIKNGVTIRSLSNFKKDILTSAILTIDVNEPDKKISKKYIGGELNKRYDWLKTFNLPSTFIYQQNHWLSTELFLKSLSNTAVSMKLDESRVTPFNLWCKILEYKLEHEKIE